MLNELCRRLSRLGSDSLREPALGRQELALLRALEDV
jgi:hypothetical protein